jgi:DNA-binding NarL/FixJ family response regulator
MEHLTTLSICIAGPIGIYNNSLNTFFRSMTRIQAIRRVYTVADLENALEDSDHSVYVIDTDLICQSLPTCLRSLRSSHPKARIIALVNDIQKMQTALASGADYAFLKGFLGDQLREAVDGFHDSRLNPDP